MFDVNKKYVLCSKNTNVAIDIIDSADELETLVERGQDTAFDYVDNMFFAPGEKRNFLEGLVIVDSSTEKKIDTELDDTIELLISELPDPLERKITWRYYNPTLSCKYASNILRYAEITGMEVYANMVADIVIEDAKVDIETWGDDAKTYYAKRFLKKVCDSQLVSAEKKCELTNLLRDI